jgi:predicted DCC family thiol-disulfide oxidoreductase YuxK
MTSTSTAPLAADKHPVVFFDGVCGLCNHTVDFLLQRDHNARLRFAPLQGTTAQEFLPDDVRTRLDTLVLLLDGRVHVRSAAVARILFQLGGFWKFAGGLLWLIPLPLRDLGYRLVSRVRYRMFGKHETCRMPTPEERARFLD